ncbi:MAG: hypothetical protein E7639_01205 [Ruminococcaceae bacterium]|nr:hypothetical protein [Oscillospiraceae bacterium]
MNGITLNKTELAAWRSLIARPDTSTQLLIAALYLASALMLPFAANGVLALTFVATCAVFYYMQTRTLRAMLLPALPVAFLFFVSGSMLLPAAFCAIVFGGASGALLIATVKEKAHLPLVCLLPPVAFLAAWAFGAGPAVAALTLLPLPVALAAGLAVRLCKPFTSSVAAIAVALASVLLLTGTVVLSVLHLLDPTLLPDLLGTCADAMLELLAEQNALYAEAGLGAALPLPDRREIVNMLTDLAYVSPALFGIICLVVAYFIWRTLCILLTALGALPRVPRVFSTPTMSVGAALLFLLSYLVVMIANASEITLTGIVAQNIGMLLEPGLALIGVGLLLRREGERSCLSTLLAIGMVYLLFTAPSAALSLAALAGATVVLLVAYQGAKKNKGEP